MLREFVLWADQDPPHDALGVRVLWERLLAIRRGDFGIPFRLTLRQLTADPLTVASPVIHVCENPAVLRAAADLKANSVALICTEGTPFVICR